MRSNAARPFVTYYDLGAGGRVELSVATFDNWVNKTAGLLRDELDVSPGQPVSVVLPAHWLGLVAVMGVWTAGAHLALEPRDDAVVSVRAAGEDVARSGEVVVVATPAFGGPAGAAASGAIDYGREVLGHPDVFAPVPPCDDPIVDALRGGLTQREDGARRVVVADRLTSDVLREGLIAPLVVDGSTVLVRSEGAADRDRIAAIARDERAAAST